MEVAVHPDRMGKSQLVKLRPWYYTARRKQARHAVKTPGHQGQPSGSRCNMRRLIATGVAATAALTITALPAAASPTYTIEAACDHATITLTGYPAGSKVYVRTKAPRYGLWTLRAGSNSFTGDVTYRLAATPNTAVSVEIWPGGTGGFTVGKPVDPC